MAVMVETAADVVVGLVWLVGGGVLLGRHDQRGTGALIVATGLTWLAGTVVGGLVLLQRGPLVHVLLAQPRCHAGRMGGGARCHRGICGGRGACGRSCRDRGARG